MFPFLFPVGVGLMGLGVLGIVVAALALAYPVLWVWMLVDAVLRVDAEYPGYGPNRKVLWIVFMVLVHPVAIAYFIAVFLRARRSPQAVGVPCQVPAAPAPPAPQAPPTA